MIAWCIQTFYTVSIEETKRTKQEQPSKTPLNMPKRGGNSPEKADGKTLQKSSELRPVSSGIKKSSSTNVAGKAKKK